MQLKLYCFARLGGPRYGRMVRHPMRWNRKGQLESLGLGSACFRASTDEGGSSLIELALLLPFLFLLLVGVVDMGRAFYAAIELTSAAAAGSVYGTQNPTDISGMQKAALMDAGDVSGMTSVAMYGCECPDGTSASISCTSIPSCTNTWLYYVQTTTTLPYKPLLIFPGVPSSLALTGFSRMRVGH